MILPTESKKNAPPNKGRKGAKNAATAAKVALMKLKMHAAGDKGLPQVSKPKLILQCTFLCIPLRQILHQTLLLCRLNERISRCFCPKRLKTLVRPCSSAVSGVLAK